MIYKMNRIDKADRIDMLKKDIRDEMEWQLHAIFVLSQ